jgi:hypothetical protein
MEAIDPAKELVGKHLRTVILACIDAGRVSLNEAHAKERMDERSVTAPEIESALVGGALKTELLDRDGCWRYCATRKDLRVIFTFDVDDEGNMLVVITAIRSKKS